MAELRYDGRVVVVTGAGNGLGKAYAHFFASKGAKVVVNDLGGSSNGKGNHSQAADQVVAAIEAAGGTAVANYNNILQGEKIIETAIKSFGRVDVLVNNAGILRDITLRNMKDEDWDLMMDVHVHGAYRTTRAAWPYFKKQKYGRVINTSSSSGLFGNFGQSNYAAAKLALVGLTETLAEEGGKYDIKVNVIVPGAASRLTQTVWLPEIMELMKPEWVVPLVGVLGHRTCSESGSIFEAAAGHFSKIRWERSHGLLLRPDENLTADLVLKNWDRITDYSKAEHPNKGADSMVTLERAMKLPENKPGRPVEFEGRVALVTGGGDGLGKVYSLHFARLGAKVVVNDLKNAENVVTEIKSLGGEATAVKLSVEDGEAVVKAVLDTYGRIDIVVNNAGILRDKAFANMTDDIWFPVLNLHLRGTYKITKAAWPHMIKQKWGRVVNITSTSGIYGRFGQANYSAAKCGIVGFTKSIAREGQKYNVIVNAVAPSAGTAMTRTVRPENEILMLKPEYVAPLIAALCSETSPSNGALFEAGSGSFMATRWQRSKGADFPAEGGQVPSVEKLSKAFPQICDFDNGLADWPDTPADGIKLWMDNLMTGTKTQGISPEDRANRKYLSKIQAAIEAQPTTASYTFTHRDVILYNLGIGALSTELPLVFEGAKDFQVLPTFGVVPTYFAKAPYEYTDVVPNYDQRMLLYGEQYLEILQDPIPTHGTLKTTTHLIEVVDKGNAALVRRGAKTVDEQGRAVFYNESVLFIRGSGGFGGARKSSDRGVATATNAPPSRAPDKIVEEKTSKDLAALYRWMGDYNPMHIDPAFSPVGGFASPILHGLATFGITGKHVYQSYGRFKNIKVRFAGTVRPGQTIVTEMWRERGRIVYQAKVKESGKLCISNAAVELVDNAKARL